MPRVNHYTSCTIKDCSAPLIAKGLCRKHYYRLKRTGTTNPPVEKTVEERFWSCVNKDGPIHPIHGQCWVWEGTRVRNEYGSIAVDGKSIRVHRYSYFIHFGEPYELFVLHKCDNPSCVNPNHLFLGTEQDNMKDRDDKGRQVRGERQHSSKLTEQHVRDIRELYVQDSSTHGSTALAIAFGVSHASILKIVNYKTWKHII